jgi:restriction system protein
MPRKPTSVIDDLLSIASRVRWWLSVILAVAAGVYLHSVATTPILITPNLHDMDSVLILSVLRGFAIFGQYIVPVLFLGAAVASLFARRNSVSP